MGSDPSEDVGEVVEAGMGMIGMVKLDKRGVREGWKVMLLSNMAPSEESVAVCVYPNVQMISYPDTLQGKYLHKFVGEMRLTAVKETKNARNSSSTR